MEGDPGRPVHPRAGRALQGHFLHLLPTDVPGWVRSLQLRQIEVPEALRDEILLVVNEQRNIDK